MRIACPMLLLIMLAAPIASAGADRDSIEIDLKREWHFSGFSPGSVKVADNHAMKLDGEFATFTCNEPGSRATYEYNLHLPVEMTKYPTFKLRYRARNIDINNTLTCIWIKEGEKAAIFPLIDFDKLTVDNQIHDIEIDLPSAPTGSQGTPFESGPIKGLLVSVMNTQSGEGSLELLEATFTSATEPPQPPQDDQPITIKVIDEQQQPVKNATIIIDAERKQSARRTTSNAEGQATITPVKNDVDQHALRVDAPGRYRSDTQLVSNDPVEVFLPKAMQIGGFIEDEQSKPIKRAVIRIIVRVKDNPRIGASLTVYSNEKGQWLSPPLPETDQIYLRISHPDYTTDPPFARQRDNLDELKSGIATLQLKKQ